MEFRRVLFRSFFIFGSGIAEDYHLRWFEQHLPEEGVTLHARSRDLLGFIVAGPRSRDLLARLTDTDVSNAAFPFMDFRRMAPGMIPAWVGRINLTGAPGYELLVAPEARRRLRETRWEAGGDARVGRVGKAGVTKWRCAGS